MTFGVLGPLQVLSDTGELRIGGPRTQRVLARLVLEAGRVVTVEELARAAWGERLPATARRQVLNRVSTVRGAVLAAGAVIETHDAGYRLRAAPDAVDMWRFRQCAQAARDETRPAAAVARYREALSLWRGPALTGIATHGLEVDAVGLEEARLRVIGECLDVELALERGEAVIPELRALTAAHPYMERFATQLMRALHAAGRLGEALSVYRQLRERLIDELGIEPGAEARRMHQQLLGANDAGPARATPVRSHDRPPGCATVAPQGSPAAKSTGPVQVAGGKPAAAPDTNPVDAVPRQLPADLGAAFVGREAQLQEACRHLRSGSDLGGPPVVAAYGLGGIGKSAFVIHAAHLVAADFPDGQFYVDLRGANEGAHQLATIDVLARFLRAFYPELVRLPIDVDEVAALFRSRFAGRRVLFVLDNASDVQQIAPLLPGAVGSAALVTARRRPGALPGARYFGLPRLSDREALQQLAAAVGAARIAAEPAAASSIVRHCDYLPLAVRIAGARAALRPEWHLETLAKRLSDAERRLDQLELTDEGVRTSLAVSYQELVTSDDPLDHAAATGLVQLSLLDGPDVSAEVAARLLDQPIGRADRLMDRLVDASLITASSGNRYRMHDLLRLYGRELAADQEPVRCEAAALTRVFAYYVGCAWRAAAVIRPGDLRLTRHDARWSEQGFDFPTAGSALAWLDSEHDNLLAAIQQIPATVGVAPELCVELAQALYGYFRIRGYWSSAVDANLTALATARRIGDDTMTADVETDLGAALGQLGRWNEALDRLHASLAIHRKLDDPAGQALTLQNLGVVEHAIGRSTEAIASYEESLRLNELVGNRRGVAMTLDNLGPLYRRTGRTGDAMDGHRRALAIFADYGDRYGQAVALLDLGALHGQLARPAQAIQCVEVSLSIFRDMGDRHGEGEALRHLGVIHRDAGEQRKAREHLEQARDIAEALGRRDGHAQALAELGHTLMQMGRADEARAAWHEAGAQLRAIGLDGTSLTEYFGPDEAAIREPPGGLITPAPPRRPARSAMAAAPPRRCGRGC